MRIPRPAHMHQTGAIGFEGTSVRHYDRAARYLLRGPYRRIARDAVSQAPPGARILDVGTGPGRLLVEIARLRDDVALTGVDLSADMVAAARRNLARFGDRATAEQADVADLAFEDGSFDVVVSSLSLHHWADPAAGTAELLRVLRPGGQIRIYDVRSAPFAAVISAASDRRAAGAGPADPMDFRVTRLPLPLIRRLVL